MTQVRREQCPECGQVVQVDKGSFVTHDVSVISRQVCQGSGERLRSYTDEELDAHGDSCELCSTGRVCLRWIYMKARRAR